MGIIGCDYHPRFQHIDVGEHGRRGMRAAAAGAQGGSGTANATPKPHPRAEVPISSYKGRGHRGVKASTAKSAMRT
jgi:hypothetical protein